MKDVVIIKLFKPEYLGDFHDLYLEGHIVGDANADFAELKTFGEKINKTILFTVCNIENIADFDNFAEISYSGTISDEERNVYVDIIKRFMRDSEITSRGELEVYSIPVTIIFKECHVSELYVAKGD